MCMKNVNVTTCCYKNVTTKDNLVISYNEPFTGLVLNRNQDCKVTTGAFVVVTQINIMGTNNEEHKQQNPMEQRSSIEFVIRLTKRDKDPEKQLGVDLDSFTINLKELEGSIDQACYPFLNYTRVTKINDLELVSGPGHYVIKVMVRDSSDEKLIIQSLNLVNMIAPN